MVLVKYIAEGFVNDSTKLLNDFHEKNSLDFSDFAEVWRKHQFSLIYILRENEKELREFTQEIFELTQKYLTSSLLWKKVGGVYMLYALYRNQIIQPPIRIRIDQDNFKCLVELFDKGTSDGIPTLQYVLDYLFKNALEIVAFPKLMGPNFRINQEHVEFGHEINSQLESEFSWNLGENLADKLAEFGQLFDQYNSKQSVLFGPNVSSGCEGFIDELNRLKREYSSLAKDLQDDEPTVSRAEYARDASSIGSRRARLKAAQFSQGVMPYIDPDYFNQETEVTDSPIASSCSTKNKTKEPKSKGEIDVDSADSEKANRKFNKSKLHVRYKPRKYEKAPRIRRYYNNDNFEEFALYQPESVDVDSDVDGELSTVIVDQSIESLPIQTIEISDIDDVDDPGCEEWKTFDAADLSF